MCRSGVLLVLMPRLWSVCVGAGGCLGKGPRRQHTEDEESGTWLP